MPSFSVANVDQLRSALGQSLRGGTIILEPGDYGSFRISNFRPSGQVTIVAREALETHFDELLIERSQNLFFGSLDVGPKDGAASTMGRVTVAVGESRNVRFSGLQINGNDDGDPTNDAMGIRVRYSSGVVIENSAMEELHRGVAVSFSSNIDVRNNSIKNVAEDGMDFAEVSGVRITGNYIGEFSKTLPGMHADAIQFMTAGTRRPSTNIRIADNVFVQGDGETFQGLFMGNEARIPYHNVWIDNNLIYTQQYHGISVGIANNVRVTNNTAVSQSGDNVYSWIMLDHVRGGIVANNVTEDVYIKPSSHAVTANNFEILNHPRLHDLFPGMSEVMPELTDLIVAGRGYQLRPFGSDLETVADILSANAFAGLVAPAAATDIVMEDVFSAGAFANPVAPAFPTEVVDQNSEWKSEVYQPAVHAGFNPFEGQFWALP